MFQLEPHENRVVSLLQIHFDCTLQPISSFFSPLHGLVKFFFGNPQRFREFPIEINVVFMHLVFIISNSGTVLLASMTSSSQLSASICHLPYRSFLQWTPADLQQTQPGFRPFQLCLGLFASKAGGGGGGRSTPLGVSAPSGPAEPRTQRRRRRRLRRGPPLGSPVA